MKKKELDTETAQQALPIKKRLLSLDALRGITVAGMILVNNAGGKVSYVVIVKTCSDIFYTIGQKKCPMPSAKIRNYSHSHNLMSK